MCYQYGLKDDGKGFFLDPSTWIWMVCGCKNNKNAGHNIQHSNEVLTNFGLIAKLEDIWFITAYNVLITKML